MFRLLHEKKRKKMRKKMRKKLREKREQKEFGRYKDNLFSESNTKHFSIVFSRVYILLLNLYTQNKHAEQYAANNQTAIGLL